MGLADKLAAQPTDAPAGKSIFRRDRFSFRVPITRQTARVTSVQVSGHNRARSQGGRFVDQIQPE
jgi:hypothetical protein